jgi:hypothetical protein
MNLCRYNPRGFCAILCSVVSRLRGNKGVLEGAVTNPQMPSHKRVIEYHCAPDAAPDNTGAKQDTRFKPGQSGNPAGRPKGARSRLATQFLDDLIERWEEDGKKALEICAKREPVAFIKVVKELLPKEILVATLGLSASVNFTDIEDARAFLKAYRRCQQEPLGHIEEGQLIAEG